MLQECFNQSQLPSPDEGLVSLGLCLRLALGLASRLAWGLAIIYLLLIWFICLLFVVFLLLCDCWPGLGLSLGIGLVLGLEFCWVSHFFILNSHPTRVPK